MQIPFRCGRADEKRCGRFITQRRKRQALLGMGIILAVLAFCVGLKGQHAAETDARGAVPVSSAGGEAGGEYIKWVDLTISYEALCRAYAWDVETHGTDHEVNWIELLAYTAARTGAVFDAKALRILEEAAQKLSEGQTDRERIGEGLDHYPYYLEAYQAALGGLVHIQDQPLNQPVVPAGPQAVDQFFKAGVLVNGGITLVQQFLHHLDSQIGRFRFLDHPEIRGEIQFIGMLPDQIAAKGMDGGDPGQE